MANYLKTFQANLQADTAMIFSYLRRYKSGGFLGGGEKMSDQVGYTDQYGNYSTFGLDGDWNLDHHGLPLLSSDQIAQARFANQFWDHVPIALPWLHRFLFDSTHKTQWAQGTQDIVRDIGVQLNKQGLDLTYSITARLSPDQNSKFKLLHISLFDTATDTQTTVTPGSPQTFDQNDKIGYYLARIRVIMTLKGRNILVSHSPNTQNNTKTITSSQTWNTEISSDPSVGFSVTNSKEYTITDFTFKDNSDFQNGVLVHDLYLTEPNFYTASASGAFSGALLEKPPALSTSSFNLPSQCSWSIPFDSSEEFLSIIIGLELARVEGTKVLATDYTEERVSMFWLIDQTVSVLTA